MLYKDWADAGIDLGGKTGEIDVLCPECSHKRKPEHRRHKCLSLNTDKQTWLCQNCGWSGGLSRNDWRSKAGIPRRFSKPEPVDDPQLPSWVVKFFRDRGIERETIEQNLVYAGTWDGKRAIAQPLIRDGEIVAVKYRMAPKEFRITKGAELIPFGLDHVTGAETVYVVEGECDMMVLQQVTGSMAVLSPPSGATPSDDVLTMMVEALSTATKIVLAGDMDEPGRLLMEKLAQRCGYDRCWLVSWPEKDANDTLLAHGSDAVAECLDAAKAYPVQGVVTFDDLFDRYMELYDRGMPKGMSTGWPELDDYYSVAPGEFDVFTGSPGSGKTRWLDALMFNLSEQGMRLALCSMETVPMERHVSRLAQLLVGRPFRVGPSERMSRADAIAAHHALRERFVFVMPEAPSVDAVLELALTQVRRHGVNGLVIDPWNRLEHARPSHMSETEYCHLCLSRIQRFAQNHGLHIWLVAHPKKPPVDQLSGQPKVVTPYDISGCYSDDTEYLGEFGWRRHSDWSGERVACFDMSRECLTWQKPLQRFEFDYTGDMMHWHGASLDCLVTPEHKMVVKPAWPYKFKRENDPRARQRGWQLMVSDDIPAALWKTPIAAPLEAVAGKRPERVVFDGMSCDFADLVKLMGWYISEGTVISCGVSLSQKRGPVLDEMYETLDRMGVAYHDNGGGVGGKGATQMIHGLRIYKRKHPELSDWLTMHCGVGSATVKIPSFAWDWDGVAKEWLFLALMQGDGTMKQGPRSGSDNWSYSTTSRQLADDVCRLVTELGRPVKVSHRTAVAENHADQFTLAIGSKARRDMYLNRNRHLSRVPYSGKVWCFETVTGAYVTRRNGRVGIQGNSAGFFNIADNCLSVWRNKLDMTEPVQVHIQKVRNDEVGKLGRADMTFDVLTGRYSAVGAPMRRVNWAGRPFPEDTAAKVRQ